MHSPSALSFLYLILPLPAAFALHGAEEILALRRRGGRKLRCALVAAPAEAALVAALVAALALLEFSSAIFAYLLYACVCGLGIHLAGHVWQSIRRRRYEAGLVTSIVLLPYIALVLYSALRWCTAAETVATVAAGAALCTAGRAVAEAGRIRRKNSGG